MQPLDAAQEQLLIADAVAAQQVRLANGPHLTTSTALNAYAPYSRFSVGAALLLENGQVFKGANVENASYGATICAERSGAICSAISQLGPAKFRPKAIAVATDLEEPASPCGICRQSLAEFGNLAVLLFSRSSKRLVKSSVQELLPLAFMPHHLDEHNSASSGKVKES